MKKQGDFAGKLPHYTKIIFLKLNEIISLLFFKLYAIWWQISLGKGISVSNIPVIRRTPGSKISIGNNCRILSKFESNSVGINRKTMFRTLGPDAAIKIGNDCGLSGVVISCASSIEIGERVMIGANCTITDSDAHSLDYRERHPNFFNIKTSGWTEKVSVAPIIIEDDVFIGMNSIILKGVRIGKRSIIGAGSVVAKSIPENVIAAGNPARIIKQINDERI